MVASVNGAGAVVRGQIALRQPRKHERGPKRVLVADDSSSGRMMMAQMLRGLELNVELADGGRSACERVLSAWKAGDPFDLVLMDSQMPGVDGMEATAQIRAAGYSGLIVALTPEYDLFGLCEKSLKVGCNAFASKPVTFPMLRDVVRRHLPGNKSLTATRLGRL